MQLEMIKIIKLNLNDCGVNMCVDHKELVRIIENHINHFESETVMKINNLIFFGLKVLKFQKTIFLLFV